MVVELSPRLGNLSIVAFDGDEHNGEDPIETSNKKDFIEIKKM